MDNSVAQQLKVMKHYIQLVGILQNFSEMKETKFLGIKPKIFLNTFIPSQCKS